ncbi:hypothetical protein A2230_04615 [candidate division WOR-1 bacterium RIFOXYA2_FULL_36_21]|uniref:Prepilin-type N-terminal cleavage/methylation domain-containing protein n=1 Tax=candidate division WOR-1 bacterium RIFOXYB2_FULL_36_35 TaxID=1802578 RepID=A0A1F4S2I9_UNCSA|nr:MAG: hypothetical protein A2230_04615 [candidate division WOR-1 bacterium RIFOXYA2_FULL_36_21]OGC14676.1 MAG: hypothetical protein A2290_01345 [candidate division WOR-1 bacterium RIFOXYB2_FULL_36_35]OGC19694.1 MAG: hypothetical protein A2282_03070 [candidate division WOR-1 bacterium RIFOXYA12_FULL_36_13]
MKKRGFTLLETIIAISLFSILLMAGTTILSSHIRSFRLVSEKTSSIQTIQIVAREITKDCRLSSNISVAYNTAVLAQKGSTISYDIKDKKVRRRKDSYTAYLTDEGEIKILEFKLLAPKLLAFSVDGVTTEVFCRN